MTRPATLAAQRSYDVHGIAIRVSSELPAALAAVDERLRAFPDPEGRAAPADRRVDVLLRDEERGERIDVPPGSSRPIYDTPYGQLAYFADADVVYGELAGVRLHCAAGEGVACIEGATLSGRELYMATHPLLTIALMQLLERRGRYSLHAACLARDGDGALLAGPSGAGKSTLALALLSAGLEFLSDDIVFLDDDPAGPTRALGFADALGVTEHGAARVPAPLAAIRHAPADGFPKRLVRVEDAFAGVTLRESCEPRVLIFPTVAADLPSTLDALDPREAWLRLVPDVLLTHPAATQSHLAALAAMLAGVRTYELRSGSDLDRAAQLVVSALTHDPEPQRQNSCFIRARR